MYKLRLTVLMIVFALTATACYRMPGEDDYSLVPFTNNPDVTRDRGSNSLMPGGSI